MLRHAFALEVKEGKTAEFRGNLGKIWPKLTAFLDAKKMVKFSMWNVERMVFGYYESDDDFTSTDADKEAVKANILQLLKEKYDIEEEDFISFRLGDR